MTCFDEFAGRWNFGVKNLKKKLIELWKKNMPVYMTYRPKLSVALQIVGDS